MAAVGVGTGAGWWPTAAVVAAAIALVFKGMWFHPWLSAGVALDVALVVAAALQWPTSIY